MANIDIPQRLARTVERTRAKSAALRGLPVGLADQDRFTRVVVHAAAIAGRSRRGVVKPQAVASVQKLAERAARIRGTR